MSAALRVAHAAETIRARWEQRVEESPQMEAAQALENTCQLLDPEVAEELKRLREENPQLRAEVAELKEQRERRRARLVALQNDALNMRGVLSPNGEARKVPMPLGETLTPAVEWLVARVAELEAAPKTVFRASHDSIVMGLYTTADEARKHCEAEERRAWSKGTNPTLDWIEDDEDGVAEMTAWVGGEECETGYVVTPLEVASKCDPEADE